MRRTDNRDDLFYRLVFMLNNSDDYSVDTDRIIVQLHRVISENPPLLRQRDGTVNCACQCVINKIKTLKDNQQNKNKIKRVEKLNKEVFDEGIDDIGLQKLANISDFHLIIKDKSGSCWREFKPNKKVSTNKVILTSHREHISDEEYLYDSDDEEEDPTEFFAIDADGSQDDYSLNFPKGKGFDVENTKWVSKEEIKEIAYKEDEKCFNNLPIISKDELVAYITKHKIYKTEFDGCEEYPQCFTSSGVGKAKFIEQLSLIYPEGDNTKELILSQGKKDNLFYKIAREANRSGFYCRNACTEERKLISYDMNKSYKSFRTDIFKGFPILNSVFKVNMKFSSFKNVGSMAHGLLYVEYPEITALDKRLYYEGEGWYPIEIVKDIYINCNIDPMIKCYARADDTFDFNVLELTNEQFRGFIGKCVSDSFESVWKTDNYLEYMRARYILQDRIVKIAENVNESGKLMYEVYYSSDKQPWNLPILSAYVHAHQKHQVFKQYNKLLDNGIIPYSVSVDAIKIDAKYKSVANKLFQLGKELGQWKIENKNKSTNPEQKFHVIERERGEFIKLHELGDVCVYEKKYLFGKYTHISGSAGTGKTHFITQLANSYSDICYMSPTNEASKVISDKLGRKAYTYHRVFGFGCPDHFPRGKYSVFVIDECSMISNGSLKKIMSMLSPSQKLIISGDFWQLECVNAKPMYDTYTDEKSDEYEKFDIRELTDNNRQKDNPEFFELCQSLRYQMTKKKSKEIIAKLNERVVDLSSGLVDNDTIDDIHICGINTQVDAVNSKHALENGSMTNGINVGSKVICETRFTYKGISIEKGNIGIVISISPFSIEFEEGRFRTHIDLPESYVSKFKLAYGLTVHKAQGKTLRRNVIINPTRLFARNHLYVALTRATSFDNIYLTEPITDGVFRKTCLVRG
jgi:hypothetical protein